MELVGLPWLRLIPRLIHSNGLMSLGKLKAQVRGQINAFIENPKEEKIWIRKRKSVSYKVQGYIAMSESNLEAADRGEMAGEAGGL